MKASLPTAGGEAGHCGFWTLHFAARRSVCEQPLPHLRWCRPGRGGHGDCWQEQELAWPQQGSTPEVPPGWLWQGQDLLRIVGLVLHENVWLSLQNEVEVQDEHGAKNWPF